MLHTLWAFELEKYIIRNDWDSFILLFYESRNQSTEQMYSRFIESLLELKTPIKHRVFAIRVTVHHVTLHLAS